MTWPLPRPPEYFFDRLDALHQTILRTVRAGMAREGIDRASGVEADESGDTMFTVDRWAEDELTEFFAAWGEDLPVLLIAEGLGGDGGRVFPAGWDRREVAFTCIVDPIDGTRGLMYGKRSAWILSGIAPPPTDTLPTLADIVLAMQTELPTPRSHLSDVLRAVRSEGVEAETRNLMTDAITPFRPRPSRADSLLYGFASIVKFFPGLKRPAVEIEERMMEALFAGRGVSPQVFDDEYISSGGQLYELMTGHDRFIADLRPLLLPLVGAESIAHRLCAHPYDLCTELIAREAGVIVTNAQDEPLTYPLDIRIDCAWAGYANQRLRTRIEPALQQALRVVTRM